MYSAICHQCNRYEHVEKPGNLIKSGDYEKFCFNSNVKCLRYDSLIKLLCT